MDIYSVIRGLELGAKAICCVESLAVQVRKADKDGNPFRWCTNKNTGGVFIALNASTKFGDLVDVEIADHAGFVAGGTITDPDTGAVYDFEPPKTGEWIRLIQPRLSAYEYKGRRKIRANINTVFQLRKVGPLGGMLAAEVKRPSRRVKSQAV